MTTVKEEILLRIDADVKGLVSKIALGRDELNTLKSKLTELKTAQEQLAASGKQGTDAFKDLTKEIILQEQSIKSAEKSIKSNQFALERQITSQNEAEGSLTQLRAQQSAANQAWDKLRGALRENSEEGKTLQKSIADINAKLKEQESQTGRNQRNVGNYASALDGVREKLQELSELRADINKQGFDDAQKTLDGINQGIATLSEESKQRFEELQTNLIETGHTAIEQAESIKELTGLMKAYSDASLKATGEVKQAFKDLAAEASDKIGDVKQEIKNLASDTSAFDAIGQGIKTAVASFTLFKGVSGLVGKENEDVQKAIEKTAQALLVLNSVTTITNALQKESALVIKGTALATTIWNGALRASTVLLRLFGVTVSSSSTALRIFTGALAATGIGAVLILLTALVVNFDKVRRGIDSVVTSSATFTGRINAIGSILRPFALLLKVVIDGLEKLGQVIGILDSDEANRLKDNIKNLEKVGEAVQNRYDFEIALAKAAGQETYDIEQEKLKAQGEAIKKQIENLFRLQQANGELNDDQKEKLAELKDAWQKNFQDILTAQTQYENNQIKQANDASLALMNIELRKQAILGNDTSAQQKEVAAKERDAALADQKLSAQQKAVIQEEYHQKILEIDNEAADKRFQLDLSVRQAQAAMIKDEREKEIEQERISLEIKLNAIRGFSAQENQLRELARQQSAQKISEINKKFAADELTRMVEEAQQKLNLEKSLTDAQDQLAITSARTKGERLAAELQVINNQTSAALEQAELDKQKELNDQDQRASESLDRLRASGEFRALTIQEQAIAENEIIQQGLTDRETIQQNYDEKELELLAAQNNLVVDAYRNANLDILEADLEFNQLKQDANTEGFNTDLALKIEQLNLQEQTELSSKERTEQEKTLIHEKYEKMRQDVTRQTEDSKLALASQALGKTSELFAKNTAAYKALAISQAYIDMYRAATAALAPPPTGAGPLFGPLLAGATVTAGLLNITKIASFKKGGYTGDGDPSSVSNALGPKPYTYHKSEYVIPAPVLKDPSVSSFVDAVIHPKVKGLRPSISSRSFAGGGYAPTANAPVFINQGPSAQDLQNAFEVALNKLPPIYTVTSELNQSINNVKAIEQRGIGA